MIEVTGLIVRGSNLVLLRSLSALYLTGCEVCLEIVSNHVCYHDLLQNNVEQLSQSLPNRAKLPDAVEALQKAADLESASLGVRGECITLSIIGLHTWFRTFLMYTHLLNLFMLHLLTPLFVESSGCFGSFSWSLPALTPSNLKGTLIWSLFWAVME